MLLNNYSNSDKMRHLSLNDSFLHGNLLFSVIAVDSEDGVAIEVPENLTLDTDFLLGQDLEFDDPDHDGKILGLEKFSGNHYFRIRCVVDI